MLFNDQVVWITGASSGIGQEMARQLAVPGARLLLTARDEARLQDVAANCRQRGAEAIVLAADLFQADARVRVAEAAVAACGRVDVVIHSAGISQRSFTEGTDPEVERRIMELDFFAPTAITHKLFPQFRKQGGGMVVAIGSVAGLMGFPLRSGYCAAKHALHGWFEALQVEHDIPGFHVLIVHPGRIRTGISKNALTATGVAHGIMDPGQKNGMPVEQCVRRIIRAMERKEHQVLIGGKERMLLWVWWFIPGLYRKLAGRLGGK
ncbi:MAG: SDR family oxidoreductase [Flavobacteriales bacterium]|nr:SDR family oxidoreductase [Flavobacteriales bacterium]